MSLRLLVSRSYVRPHHYEVFVCETLAAHAAPAGLLTRSRGTNT